ncbi:MAG: cysteine-rich small domain-containing protein [Defluviitaleaceae bacterium]|nr:cysteine-rich small domain-containing protein [Defluviitaleaceae bacterium]
MENSYRYFCNEDCQYFPCHEMPREAGFNCLFCYCPLYALGRDCGGDFDYSAGIKDCSGCDLPHRPEKYDYIIGRLADLILETRQ